MEVLCIWSLKSKGAPDTASICPIKFRKPPSFINQQDPSDLVPRLFHFHFLTKNVLFCFLKANEQTKDYFSSMKLFRNNGTSSQLAKDTSTTPTQTFIYIYFNTYR
jgi:hypothetical protein